ncbi:armadillo repeat-containing protein 6 homolog isoform X2 [Zootermopsis nevadensis]|nr:armadillo repeat-containing protein 6 homolog isoform X2 [Zootermopsis nevadensis]XP_021913500.1 armadillo repeat-containing protein 6 homolog isoform X2 [Zootermopsis nevadensis]
MSDIPDASRSKLTSSLDNIAKLMKEPAEKEKIIIEELRTVKDECDKSIANKVFAGSLGAYSMLIDVLESFNSVNEVASEALSTVTALMSGNPDLLDKRGREIIINYLDNQKNVDIQKKVLEWAKVCCIKHEQNRQDLFGMKILIRLKTLLHSDTAPVIVRQVCGVARALVLDDDIRVQFGKSHDHARDIALEILCTLTDLLKKFKGDKETVSDVILTLTALIVRNEFCQMVDEAGGIIFIMDVFVNCPDSEKLNRLCLNLVKGLAGNDDVKARIVKQGIAPLIISAMHRHESSARLVGAGCAAIAALSLRNPVNSKALCAAGAPDVILQGMKIHAEDSSVQKQGSWAVRNLVSHDKTLCQSFMKLGAEDILRTAVKVHSLNCDFDAKAALRDLGCDIE